MRKTAAGNTETQPDRKCAAKPKLKEDKKLCRAAFLNKNASIDDNVGQLYSWFHKFD